MFHKAPNIIVFYYILWVMGEERVYIKMGRNVGIAGMGFYVPENVVTNKELEIWIPRRMD